MSDEPVNYEEPPTLERLVQLAIDQQTCEPLTIEELLRALIVGDVWGGGFIDVGDDRAIIDGFCLLPPGKAKWLGEMVKRLEAEVERGKLQAR